MANPRTVVPANAADHILETALTAFARGAGRMPIAAPAAAAFRAHFIPRIDSALERPDWRELWRREKVYVLAIAHAMGRWARRMAAEDRRTCIGPQDIGEAMHKLRGYMPVAGRWGPF
jgi:hypothetical protein